ncbi:MAG TPA: glycosyltransferase family 2 protein [Vicinamibacteria bacterium]|nr:glycosyltransferase family 2 protein [Vicinamibacteria bacterium]
MFHEHKVFVTVPAFDEQERIESTLTGVPDFVDRIVVVDDGSSDSTGERVERRRNQDPRIVLLRHQRKAGVGAATLTGFRWSAENGADVVVKMDGDGQMNPTHLPELLEPLVAGQVDYVKGNRFLDASELQSMPKLRLLGNFFLTFLTKLASGYWSVFDPQNGFVALRTETLDRLPLDGLANGYFFENDMLVRLNVASCRVRDVRIPARYTGEKSKMSLWRVAVTFPLLLAHRFWYRIYQKYVLRDFSPIALFYGLGIPLLVWGFFFGLAVWVHSIVYSQVATVGTVMLSALPVIVGLQLVLQAIVLEIQESKVS